MLGRAYFYTRDHLGSVRELTNSTGTVSTRMDYDPYGVTTVVSGTVIPDFAYAGMYQHQPSGNYLSATRLYNPNLGRWLTRDPIAESGGLNMYAYCGNDPINNVDPSGLLFVVDDAVEDTWIGWETGLAIGDAITDGLIYYAPTIARALLATGIIATTASLKSDSTDCPEKDKEKEEEEDKSKSKSKLPILYVSRAVIPQTAQHIADAIGQGQPSILTYNGKSDPLTDLNRKAAMADVPLSPSGWRDEYPFASTLQGGSGSSVRYSPASEQLIQAGQLSAFYRYVLKGKSAQFIVVVGP